MKTKIITFWSPVKRQGGCSTNVALYASYLSSVMEDTEKAVIYSLNKNADAADYLTSYNIRNGGKELMLLSETNNVNCKEDVLAYTHKLSDNFDILGTGKEGDIIEGRIIQMTEILAIAYDYIIIDSVTDRSPVLNKIIEISDLIVVCIPQDKFVYEEFNMNILENKKVIFLSAMHIEKNELSLSKIQSIVPVQVYKISRNDKVNQAVYEQEVFNYICNEFNKKSTIINELKELHNEIHRIINLEKLNITYEIKKAEQKDNAAATVPEIKVIKEYKFIKAKNNIAVINLSEGAGSTFITLNLAYMLREKKVDVSVVEIPHKKMKTDILNIISKNDEDYNYISVSESISSGSVLRREAFFNHGIKFFINNKKISSWSVENNIDYISLISKESNINIYDIGSQVLESSNILLSILDVLIVIIEPMPYKLLQVEEKMKYIKSLEEKGVTIIYVINKYIKDLNKRDIEKYLQVKISSCIPFISPETIYAAYYSGQIVFQLEKSEIFRDSLQKILSAANILDYQNKKENRRFKIFNRR
jgi:Flp pilus assembly CpaE family ATPase